MSTEWSMEGGKNIKRLEYSSPQWSSRKGLRFADYSFQEGFLLADRQLEEERRLVGPSV